MRTYQPPAIPSGEGDTAGESVDTPSESSYEKSTSTGTSVAPLVQFFELVHIGDMIQSIVQVYFDKELVCTASRVLSSF